jgi:DNA-binding PadR family transcriptional regulator
MSDDPLRQMFTGFVRLHILYHADKEPICGVEIMEELRHHGYRLGPGTLYPILHHLHESGYLKRQETVVDGKRRKNFRITPRGKRLLDEAKVKLRELVGEVLEDRDGRAGM